MKMYNLILVFKDQLPFSRLLRNLAKGHLIGLFSNRSHFRSNGEPKVTYNTKETAIKSAKEDDGKNWNILFKL